MAVVHVIQFTDRVVKWSDVVTPEMGGAGPALDGPILNSEDPPIEPTE